ncbi:MAG TPA: hypothetical protein VHY08_17080 [Bacillota bacterium]|nr:hypothetical protein [Bacillota bacterium]
MLLLLLIYSLIGLFQAPGLIKDRQWRELSVFVIFYSMAFLLSLLYVLGVKIPSQFVVMRFVTEDLFHLKY